MKRKRILALVTACVFLTFAAACGDSESQTVTGTAVSDSSDAADESENHIGRTESSDSASEESEAAELSDSGGSVSLSDISAYSGIPYTVINENVPYFSESDLTTTAFETYSELDSLGRCGVAFANICQELMPTEERGRIGEVKPTGWHLIKYEGIDGNYLYNRCHLIGFQLAGENANEKNLITGTRYLNVDGMLPYENLVADYVDETDNHVLYRVTPLFDGDNLVASGVLMEGWSVEDDGSGICFNVYCYNVQPGIGIDYATGDSFTDGTIVSSQTEVAVVNGKVTDSSDADTVQTENSNDSAAESGDEITYILNTNTKKFHYPNCSSVSQMKDKNKQEFTGTRKEAINMGYDPCGNCNP